MRRTNNGDKSLVVLPYSQLTHSQRTPHNENTYNYRRERSLTDISEWKVAFLLKKKLS